MVKTLLRWAVVTSSIVALTAGYHAARDSSATAQANILNLQRNQTVSLEGTSSGPVQDKVCAGFIPKEPNHLVNVETASNLNFSLEGANDATLLILGDKDQRLCVQADGMSKGKISIPGRWKPGKYQIFVGSRDGVKQGYKLTIGPLDI